MLKFSGIKLLLEDVYFDWSRDSFSGIQSAKKVTGTYDYEKNKIWFNTTLRGTEEEGMVSR